MEYMHIHEDLSLGRTICLPPFSVKLTGKSDSTVTEKVINLYTDDYKLQNFKLIGPSPYVRYAETSDSNHRDKLVLLSVLPSISPN